MLIDTAYAMNPDETQNIPFTRFPSVDPPVDQVSDNPRLVFGKYDNNLNYPIRFYEDANFSTRLVFRPPGGIWISLGTVTWNLHGEWVFQFDTGFAYTNSASWGGTESYNGPPGGNGTMVPELRPEWTANSQPYLQEWTGKKP